MEYTHLVVIKGNYQIVAITQNQHYDPADISHYAVQTAAGATLQQDMTLEAAKIWLDARAQDEATQQIAHTNRIKPTGRTR